MMTADDLITHAIRQIRTEQLDKAIAMLDRNMLTGRQLLELYRVACRWSGLACRWSGPYNKDWTEFQTRLEDEIADRIDNPPSH